MRDRDQGGDVTVDRFQLTPLEALKDCYDAWMCSWRVDDAPRNLDEVMMHLDRLFRETP